MPPPPRRTSIAWPLTTLVASTVAVVAVGYAVWCTGRTERLAERPPEATEPTRDRLVLEPADLEDLPGWQTDALLEAVPALEKSCRVWERRDPDAPIGAAPRAGLVRDWLEVCRALLQAPTEDALRDAIGRRLRPYAVRDADDPEGLFTGYYEPLLHGSRHRSERYRVPLYRKPNDIVEVDLERFDERWAGESISGRISGDGFEPYYERADIAAGALADRGLELVWVDDPVAAFFLHIQGSGRVALAEGGEMRVGYAGQNGRPYVAIGRELVARGALTLEEVSLQSIRSWLLSHPGEAAEVMAANPSYIFFRELSGEGPVGTLGVALTPGRSLAVDASYLPLGVPLWVDTRAPAPGGGAAQPLRRLMVAQDTGGAIRGPVRGDVFFGHGAAAEAIAGRMKHEGRLWLLLPRSLGERPERPKRGP